RLGTPQRKRRSGRDQSRSLGDCLVAQNQGALQGLPASPTPRLSRIRLQAPERDLRRNRSRQRREDRPASSRERRMGRRRSAVRPTVAVSRKEYVPNQGRRKAMTASLILKKRRKMGPFELVGPVLRLADRGGDYF